MTNYSNALLNSWLNTAMRRWTSPMPRSSPWLKVVNLRMIFTIDRKDFAIYRIKRGRRYFALGVIG